MNGTHISHFDRTILMLETSHCLNSTYCRKDQHSQYEKQQQDDNAQFGAFARLVQLLLTSFFYPVKILNMGLKIARFLCSVIVASVLTHNPLVNSSNNMLIADLFTVMIAC